MSHRLGFWAASEIKQWPWAAQPRAAPTFLQTLTSGLRIFDTAVERTKKAGGTQLPGDQAFALHDTYGFPLFSSHRTPIGVRCGGWRS